MNEAKIGWKATAGSVDINELISEFQSALGDEIEDLKRGKGGRRVEVYDGKRIQSDNGLQVYHFPLGEPINWVKDDLPVKVIIKKQIFQGRIIAFDTLGINIGIELDNGDMIDSAIIQNSSHKLLEELKFRLSKMRVRGISTNFDGAKKLFGFKEPIKLEDPIFF